MKKNIIGTVTISLFLASVANVSASTLDKGIPQSINAVGNMLSGSTNKLFLLIIPVLLALVILFVIGIYYFYKKSKKLPDSQIPPSTPVSQDPPVSPPPTAPIQ